MLQTKVKISKVNNLTDARYFAAMGVDYLGFCCNTGTEMYCAPSKISEIIQWVEGPKVVLELDGWQSEEDIHTMLATGLGHAIHFGAFATYTTDFSVPVFKDFILENAYLSDFDGVTYPVIRSDKNFKDLTEAELRFMEQSSQSHSIFLDIDVDDLDIPTIIESLPRCGLILRGGEEEKTGFKSYQDLDNIFSALE